MTKEDPCAIMVSYLYIAEAEAALCRVADRTITAALHVVSSLLNFHLFVSAELIQFLFSTL